MSRGSRDKCSNHVTQARPGQARTKAEALCFVLPPQAEYQADWNLGLSTAVSEKRAQLAVRYRYAELRPGQDSAQRPAPKLARSWLSTTATNVP